MEQKDSLRRPAKAQLNSVNLPKLHIIKRKIIDKLYLVVCSCMFSNKLNGLRRDSKEKSSNIDIFCFLNCLNGIVLQIRVTGSLKSNSVEEARKN